MLLPPMLRSTTLVDWLSSLVHPLDEVMDLDWDYIYDQYIKGHLTGQKMVMQAGLNALFRIEIAPFILVETVREDIGTTYMYNKGELFKTYMYNKAEASTEYMTNKTEGGGEFDFIVKLPNIYASDENKAKLEQQVNIIKLTGKTFDIITY